MPDRIETQVVQFRLNGGVAEGYLARPEGSGPMPGVIVVQEWWGIDDHVKDVARRFASEGFAAFAPDLYHGRVTKEPDEAQKMMMGLDMNRASFELSKAADHLAAESSVGGRGLGAVGFCMGGGLALTLACDNPHIRAAAPFYGVNPQPIDKVRNLNGPVFAVYAENDSWVTADVRESLREAMRRFGKQFEAKVYPGTHHAFFNDTRSDVYVPDAAHDAWQRVLALFRANL